MARRRRTTGTRDPSRAMVLLATTLLLAGAMTVAGPVSAQSGEGIGVAPSTLRIDDPPLVRGGSMERTLSFQQHDHDVARVEVRVLPPTEPDAQDASGWVTLDPGGEIDVPRTSDHPVKVKIDVPVTAANGHYRAKVEFRVLQACDSSGSCAAVQTAASSILAMTVGGEQVKRIKVLGSPDLNDAEEGGPLQFRVPLENTGNVDADPTIRLQIQDKHQTKILRTYWFNQTVLKPGESGSYTQILRDLDLPRDQYWAIVTVYLDGVLVKTANPQTFDVLEAGALARSAVLKTIRITGDLTTAAVGDLVKLSAIVQNTGQAPVVAQFKGEVWVDGVLRDTFASDPREIAIGETAPLEVIYVVQHGGQHEFKGRAQYGSKVTEERSLLLAVEGEAAAGAGLLWVGLGLLLLVGVVSALVFVGRSRKQAQRRRRRGPLRAQRGPPPAGAAASARGVRAQPPVGRPPQGSAAKRTTERRVTPQQARAQGQRPPSPPSSGGRPPAPAPRGPQSRSSAPPTRGPPADRGPRRPGSR